MTLDDTVIVAPALSADIPPNVAMRRAASRAVGRCYGALFFSFFGGVWLSLAATAFGEFSKAALPLAVIAAVLIATALLVQRRGWHAAKGAYPEEEERRNGRTFGIVNAVQFVAIFSCFQIFPRFGHQDFAFVAMAFIVGAHFFFMPPLYRNRGNTVTGICLTIWALACPWFSQGDRLVGIVALGAGTLLWLSAAWAMTTANRLLRSASL